MIDRLCRKIYDILLYTLPGIPSIYYSSEFGIEGRKERHSDDSLRPSIDLTKYRDAVNTNPVTRLIKKLGELRHREPALSYGDYRELLLTTGQYVYSRTYQGRSILVTLNNEGKDAKVTVPCTNGAAYVGALSGQKVTAADGKLSVTVKANFGEIWVPAGENALWTEADLRETIVMPQAGEKPKPVPPPIAPKMVQKPYEEMTVAELQQGILACMAKNGPVTDYMRKTVAENV